MSDLIDRQKAIQCVKELFSRGESYCDELSIIGMLNGLPSIEPKRKKANRREKDNTWEKDNKYEEFLKESQERGKWGIYG